MQLPERRQQVCGTSDPTAITTTLYTHHRSGTAGHRLWWMVQWELCVGSRNRNRLLLSPSGSALGSPALAVLHQAEWLGLLSYSKWGVGELKSYIKTRICGVSNNVETRKRYPMRHSYQKHKQWCAKLLEEKPETCPGWPQLYDGAGYASASLGTWDQLSKKLNCFSSCFAGKRFLPMSHCGFCDMPSCQCLRAANSCQWEPRRKPWVPNCSQWLPLFFMGTEAKQQKWAGFWPLSWLMFAPFKS